jgi:predicted O-linked N-acetylglucosamine transferase (SPINDLY family)
MRIADALALAVRQAAAGRTDVAEKIYDEILRFDPRQPDALHLMGRLRLDQERHVEARHLLETAVAVRPDHGLTLLHLAELRQHDGADAAPALRGAVLCEPGDPVILSSWGAARQRATEIADAIAFYRRARAAAPLLPAAADNLLFCMALAPGYDDRAQWAENRAWGELAERGLPPARPLSCDRDPERRLRIGYVAPDLTEHRFLSQIEPVLAAQDRQAFEIVWFVDARAPDRTGVMPRAELVDRVVPIHGLDRERRAALIREMGIDILVNLLGFLTEHRQLFATRLAPVQLAYPINFSTTGLTSVDWRISDPWVDPPGVTEPFNTERLWRLESGFLCYSPPSTRLPIGDAPRTRNAHLTFGSFNTAAKITVEAAALWHAILDAVPDARLLVKAPELSRPDIEARLRGMFRDAGHDLDRVRFVGHLPTKEQHLATIAEADIALDSFPFGGGFTAIDAMWMGVPVIALKGDSVAGRFAYSTLMRLDLPELVATSHDDYRDKAVALAADAARLAAYRRTLRDRLAASSLFDFARHTRELEAALREMWRQAVAA